MPDLKHPPRKLAAILAVAMAAVFLLSACGYGYYDYGRMNPSREISSVFENFQVLDGYRYYYSGSDTQPNAILGIAPGYSLKSKVWKPVDLNEDELKAWIAAMNRNLETRNAIRGSVVEDFKGNDVGVWYSDKSRTQVVVKDKDVHISLPET